jgi:hypothetical protein
MKYHQRLLTFVSLSPFCFHLEESKEENSFDEMKQQLKRRVIIQQNTTESFQMNFLFPFRFHSRRIDFRGSPSSGRRSTIPNSFRVENMVSLLIFSSLFFVLSFSGVMARKHVTLFLVHATPDSILIPCDILLLLLLLLMVF